MAHRGRFFPVHFRRDFNRDTNAGLFTSFAQAYNVVLNSGVVPGYIVDGERFRVQEIAGPNPSTIAWLSPSRTIGIWDWQLRLLVSFWQLPDTQLQPTWILYRDAIMVSSWRPILFSYNDPIRKPPFLPGQVLFTDETTFERGADFNNSLVSPAEYGS